MDVWNIPERRQGLDRQVKSRGRAGKAVAEKAGGRNANDDYGLGVDPEGAAHNGRIPGVIIFPGRITHHCNHRSAGNIVGIDKQAAHLWPEPESPKVVAGNKFAHDRARVLMGCVATNNHLTKLKARLHSGKVFKFRRAFS
jgi:hypothetical protein